MVPIKNIILPRQGVMEGDEGAGIQDFYDVDLEKLTADQFQAILIELAHQACCPVGVVRDGIKAQGTLPLRGKHVMQTSSDDPFFL